MRRLVLLLMTMSVVLVLASGVALAASRIGTDSNDTIKGTDGGDSLIGRGGNDRITGLGGNDNIIGGTGNDYLFGGNSEQTSRVAGDDTISGNSGDDVVVGGYGADTLQGGSGDDKLIDPWEDTAVDTVQGGGGNDFVNVANEPGSKDIVSCGSGNDRVQADDADIVSEDCEQVEILQDVKREVQAQQNQEGGFSTQRFIPPGPGGGGDANEFSCLVYGRYRAPFSNNLCAVTDTVDPGGYVLVSATYTEGDRPVGFAGRIETGLFIRGTITLRPFESDVLWTNYNFGLPTVVGIYGQARSWSNTYFLGNWDVLYGNYT